MGLGLWLPGSLKSYLHTSFPALIFAFNLRASKFNSNTCDNANFLFVCLFEQSIGLNELLGLHY